MENMLKPEGISVFENRKPSSVRGKRPILSFFKTMIFTRVFLSKFPSPFCAIVQPSFMLCLVMCVL